MVRLTALVALLALALPAVLAVRPSHSPAVAPPASASPYGQYADVTFNTYIATMYNRAKQELRIQVNSSVPSWYWNTAVAFQSLLHYADYKPSAAKMIVSLVYGLIDTQTRLNMSDSKLRNGYNDDMSWMIHGLTALYDHTGNRTLVDMAVLLHDYIRLDDDTTCCGTMPGGLWWDRAHSGKATASQAGATLAALRLMETGVATKYSRDEWLDWAIAHYDFWHYHMVNESTGQVCDSIGLDGRQHWGGTWTYNEGLMLGCAVHLYQATNDTRFLKDAALYTRRLVSEGETVTVNGQQVTILLNDNRPQCGNDSSQFHQVSFHYLSEYYRLLIELKMTRQASSLYEFLQHNIDSLWSNARDSVTGVTNCNWDLPFNAKMNGQNGLQGAMNSAMSATALFAALPPPQSLASTSARKE